VSGSLLPVALIAHVVNVAHVPDAMTAVGALLLPGSVIVTLCETELNLPHTSVAVSVIVYVPAMSYVCDGFADVLVLVVEGTPPKFASPKVHAYLTASLSGSTVPALLVVQTVNVGQLTENTAAGGWLPAGSTSETLRVVEANLPQPSVVVSVIVYEPGVAYVCADGVAPVLSAVPSPQFHE
jgi:hypothetical protein